MHTKIMNQLNVNSKPNLELNPKPPTTHQIDSLKERSDKLMELCRAKSGADPKDQAKNEFTEKFHQTQAWLLRVIDASMQHNSNLGSNFNSAKDFLDLHQCLVEDMKVGWVMGWVDWVLIGGIGGKNGLIIDNKCNRFLVVFNGFKADI